MFENVEWNDVSLTVKTNKDNKCVDILVDQSIDVI